MCGGSTNPNRIFSNLAVALTISLMACLGAFGTASADSGPWYEFATGSCNAPIFTAEVTAGQTILLVSGGLMAGSPFDYIISPYGDTSRPAWWNTEQTVSTDSNGNVCVEAFVTEASDYGMFIVTIHSLDANQRQYNPATRGITVLPAPTPALTATVAPESTEAPVPALTQTATPVPTETAAPTETQTPLPTSTPVPTDTPAPTQTPVPTETQTPLPTHTPIPTDTPAPTQTPMPTETQTPLPTDTPVPTDTLAPTQIPVLGETVTPMPTASPAPAYNPTVEPTESLTSESSGVSQSQPSETIGLATEGPVIGSTPAQPSDPAVIQPNTNTSVSATQVKAQAVKSTPQPQTVYRSSNRPDRMDLQDAQVAPYAQAGLIHGAATKVSEKTEPEYVIGQTIVGKLIMLLVWFIS